MNKNELITNIGKFIRRTRRKAYLSQKKLSIMAGLSPTYISRLERGKVCPTIDIICKICEVLNISVCDLLIFSVSKSNLDLEIKHRIETILERFPDSKKLSFIRIIEDVAKVLE